MVTEMNVRVTYMIRAFTLATEEGFQPPVVEAPSGPRSSRLKSLDGQACNLTETGTGPKDLQNGAVFERAPSRQVSL